MKLAEMVDCIKHQAIYRLVYNNHTLGIRIKYFNVSKQSFEWYDFDLDNLKGNKNLYKYMAKNRSKFKVGELKLVNGNYCTVEELNNGIFVSELETLQQIESILKPMVNFYARGYIE